eukprot:1608716-Amphidinium_carterae.1
MPNCIPRIQQNTIHFVFCDYSKVWGMSSPRLAYPSFSLLATTAAPLQSVTMTQCPRKRSQASMMAWSSA